MRMSSELIDARGLLCPMPIVRLARVAKTSGVGSELVLLSDDPAAATDVPAWCRLRGQEFISATTWDGSGGPAMAFTVRIATQVLNAP